MRFLLLAFLLTSAMARAEDFATRAMEATYKIFNKDSTATGFFVREPKVEGEATAKVFLATANHVFAKASGDQVLVVLRIPNGDGTWKRRDLPVKIRADGKPLWFAHAKEDVAVLKVDLPADAEVKPLPFEALAGEKDLEAIDFHLASSIFVLGFPTRFEANQAGFPVVRHASVASFPLRPVKIHHTFLADFTTFAGDSGGPVFLADTRNGAPAGAPLLVGIVLAQMRHDEKTTTLNGEQTTHYPLELGVVLQAHYVREAIELAPADEKAAVVEGDKVTR